MISRYARPEAVAIWSAQTKYKIWFEIEAHAADAMAELGVIPKEAAKAIWAGGKDAIWDSTASTRSSASGEARRHRLPDPCHRRSSAPRPASCTRA